MPRRVKITDEMLDYLEEALDHDTHPLRMAAHLGIDVTTVKRILIRECFVDPSEFPGAKYQVAAPDMVVEMWERPCSSCKTTDPRPKWTYYCTDCATRLGHHRTQGII